MECGKCNSKNIYDKGEFNPKLRAVFQCDDCGANYIDGTWKKICKECKKETEKLYDLFVPHHCKECSDKLHKQAQDKGDYCSLCGYLRMDCCC